ncbi:MAG: MFS transporter [Saprospiraceae bacterium]|nr:MFS transporter [Bacteroidia bacterium]NNE15092.1 MFS transporter [Saprospiraceae bacterium]NNL93836.1 MFS transporter [Saprospiraceae bacterium]
MTQDPSHLRIKISLYINYFVFAILLNSVGIVILKSQNIYGVDEVAASTLELFKDLPIAIVSFLVASFLPRIGYKKAMLIGLLTVALACVVMYFGNSFWTAKLLFACVGASFALIKISVYAMIGIVTEGEKEHNSLMSNIEGFFMFGIALAYFLFPAFNSESHPDAWLNVYWLLAGLSLASFAFLWTADFKEDQNLPGVDLNEDFKQMFLLMTKLLVAVFVMSAFLFVMVEQGIMTWLPTFNDRVLNLSFEQATMMSSILAISLGIGRFLAGYLAKFFSWFWILLCCIILTMLVLVFILPQAINAAPVEVNSFSDIPIMGYIFPMIGLFIAPIYPLLNSAVLSALPKKVHSSMAGLIIIFSAIGGSLGSRMIGILFKEVGGDTAFYYTLIPMGLLLVTLIILYKLTSKQKQSENAVT